MRLLQRDFDVETRYGGGFVQEIDGVARRARERPAGRLVLLRQRHRGAESARPRARLAPGDRVWWDHHDWERGAARPGRRRLVPGAVRVRRSSGKQLPVRLDCADDAERVVRRGRRRGSSDAGVHGRRALGRSAVGRARRCCACSSAAGPTCARDAAARRLERGPGASSGVFARPTRDRRRDRAARRRGRDRCARSAPGAGLVAATRSRGEAPTWVVTGTDDVGVAAAAARADRGARSTRPLRARGRAPAGRSPLPVADAGGGAVTYRRAREPAARRARRRSASLWCVALGARRAVVRAPAAARPRCWRCDGRRRGRRAGRPPVLRALALWALPFALADRGRQRARRRATALTVVIARLGDGARARAARRHARGDSPTAACSACARWSSSAASRCTRAAVDPDELLRAFRRVSFRSGADRGARDAPGAGARAATPAGSRDAQRCRPGAPASRLARPARGRPRARSTARSTSPRRSRCAATARGAPAAAAARGRGRATTSRSRASAVALAALAIGALASAAGRRFEAYPRSRAPLARRAARARGRARRLRAAAVRRPPGDRPMSALALERVTYALSRTRRAPALRDVDADGRAGRVRRARRRLGLGQVDAAARRLPGSCRTSTAATFAGRLRGGGLDTREHGPAELAAVAGTLFQDPETQVVMGTRARRARVPAREPRLERRRGRARGGGGGARARHRGAARPLDARALRRRAAARRARRRARRPPAAAAARRADLAARPGRRRRAARRAAAASTRSGGRRSCSPSTGSSAAWPPPTA